MIVGYVTDPYLRGGLLQAASREEDVVLDPTLADEAVTFGYPRVVVRHAPSGVSGLLPPPLFSQVPLLVIGRNRLAQWEARRLAYEIPPPRAQWLGRELRGLLQEVAAGPTWVDRALGDLGRAVGAPLPPSLRGFARRVMEFPSHYHDLRPLARACGMSRGALKARFRRRGLASPSVYLRWFRALAVAYALSDRTASVVQVSTRLGFTSDGNMCRALTSLTGQTPTEVRTLHGWNRLLITFAWTHLDAAALAAWRELGDVFTARAA